MDSSSLRHAFLNFFKEKGHAIVPSSSLVPDDPSVLLTTAGMQQFKPYYTGAADPFVSPHPTLEGKPLGSRNATSIQKSFRTSDIDEVGDERHLTFFEMMGNFSFGGYFKEGAIKYAYDFFSSIGLKIQYVTIFAGDEQVPKDQESKEIWKKLGVRDIHEEGRADNFWGPTGNEGPCGPTTEIYVNDVEIWNIVFNEYYCKPDGSLEKLSTPGVDTGMGLERLAMVSQGKKNIFETDLFSVPFRYLFVSLDIKASRITADHVRASIFLLSDGIRPSNKEAGYVLRRLIRRALLYSARKLELPAKNLYEFTENAVDFYGEFYIGIKEKKADILQEFRKESERFKLTLENGLREFDKRYPGIQVHDYIQEKPMEIDILGQVGINAFDLYQTYGFPIEEIKQLLEERLYQFDEKEFRKKVEEEFQKHQEISRAGQERKFGGHGLLLDTGELKAANEEELKIVTRLHTATHLLQAALRKILGETVHQAGSDITVERTRFDFTYDRKLTPEELKSTEQLINEAIEKDLAMEYGEMPFQEAIATGALYSPREKYPGLVKVYSAWNPQTEEVFSRELCGGPHVTHTLEVGKVKIMKEEAVSSGIRRIRAVLE